MITEETVTPGETLCAVVSHHPRLHVPGDRGGDPGGQRDRQPQPQGLLEDLEVGLTCQALAATSTAPATMNAAKNTCGQAPSTVGLVSSATMLVSTTR